MKKVLATCTIIKNTPLLYINEFILHNLSIGVDDVHICLDKENICDYSSIQNNHVYFYNYNDISDQIEEYAKYVNFNDPCHRLNKWYSYFLYTIGRLNYQWVALIDDDEYLHIDTDKLNDYADYQSLYIPWNYKYNCKIRKDDEDNIYYIKFCKYLIDATGGWCYKSIINTAKLKEDESYYGLLACHFGFNDGVDEQKMSIISNNCNEVISSVINTDKRLYPNFIKYTMYIEHYYSRSFEEIVEKIFDRGDSAVTKNDITSKIIRLKEEYNRIFTRRTLDSLELLLKKINRYDILNELYTVNNVNIELSIPNVGICCMVKDTKDYLIKAFIEHHLLLGIKDIYIYIDYQSQPIYRYNDSRVHYYEVTQEMNLEFRKLGFEKLIDGNKDLGVQRQVGGMNYMLEQHRKDHDWLAFIDDDEFLNVELRNLNYYTSWDCVYIPWRCYYTTYIKCQNNINNVKTLVDANNDLSNRTDWNWLKSIVNTSRINEIHHIHWGNYKGVMMDYPDFRWNAGNKFILCSLKTHYLYSENYIAHYQVRSFEEWVEKIVDRKDMLKRLWQGYYYGRSLKQYFIMLIECGEDILYSKKYVEKYLKEINREDVLYSCEYDWAEIQAISYSSEPILVIYSISNSQINQTVIDKCRIKYNDYKNVMVIDYDKAFFNDDVLYYDKNIMLAWMAHTGVKLNCWDEWWILMLTLRLMYPNINEDDIKVINTDDI